MNQKDDGNFDNIDQIITYWNQFLKVAKKNPKAKELIPGAEDTIKGLTEMKTALGQG